MAEAGDRRTGWGVSIVVLLSVLLGTMGTLGTSGSSEGEARRKTSGSPAPAESGAGEDGKARGGLSKGDDGDRDYRKPYLEFRDFHGASGRPTPEGDLGQLLAQDASRMAPEFLIVTVPEPVDSRFGYRFDAILDAVQMAIESQGWNLDRFWLPWLPSGRQFKDRAELKPVADPDGKAMLYERKPGVMLFRKPRKSPAGPDQRQRVLVVLLVAETPTSGVAKAALAECFKIVGSYHAGVQKGAARLADFLSGLNKRAARLAEYHRLTRVCLSPLSGKAAPLLKSFLVFEPSLRSLLNVAFRRVDVRIVGPMFSGSEQSLSLTISQWLEEGRGDPSWPWTVFVRTGDSDRIDKQKFEQDAGDRRLPNVTVRFDATVIYLDTVMKALFDFLKTLNGGKPLGKVALLTESDTAFGKDFDKEHFEEWTGTRTAVTTMKFPFHVSQVAVAYHQSDRKDDRSTPTLVRPSSRLTIPFDETGNPRDVVPALSPAMATATNSFVLAKILETISMEDFRYIGIIATDTRDTIFLTGLIQRYCPDVQLFAPSGDLLLGHPQYADTLRGMIVATPYPLFSMAQRWDPPHEGDHRRHLFSHQGDQGTYNATLSLLYETSRPAPNPNAPFFDALFDYGLPFDEMKDLELIWRDRLPGGPVAWSRRDRSWSLTLSPPSMRPALWFSVIGQRGLWPVRYADVGGRPLDPRYTFNAGYTKPIHEKEFVGQFPAIIPQFTWQWGTVFLALSGFAWLLFGLHAYYALAPRGRFGPGFSWAEILRPLDTTSHRPHPARAWRTRDRVQRELFVLTGLLVLLIVYNRVALYPCWVAFWYSPMAVFVDLPRALVAPSELWSRLANNDRHNLRFAWLALDCGHVTFLALLGAVLLRLNLWWNPTLPITRPWLLRVMAAAALACLLPDLTITWLFRWRWSYHPEGFQPLLSFERAVNLGSGVSPLVPLLMLALVFGLWIGCQLRRLSLAERFWGPPRKTAAPDWLARLGGHLLQGAGWLAGWGGSAWKHAARSIRTYRDAHREEAGRHRGVLLAAERGARRLHVACVWLRHFLREERAFLLLRPPAGAAVAGSPAVASPSNQGMIRPYEPPPGRAHDQIRRVVDRIADVELMVEGWLPPALLLQPPTLAAVGLWSVVLIRLWQRSLPGVDFPGWQTTLVMSAIWFLALTIIISLCRFVSLWLAISTLLRELVRWPMARAYDRIPRQFSRSFGRYLDQIRPSLTILTIPVQQWAAMARTFHEAADEVEARVLVTRTASRESDVEAPDVEGFARIAKAITTGDPDHQGTLPTGSQAADAILGAYEEEIHHSENAGRDEIATSRTWVGLLNASRACVTVLSSQWGSTRPATGFGEPAEGQAEDKDADSTGSGEALRRWVREAEDLIALGVVTLASQCTVHLKNMAYYLALGPILLLMTVASYPFQPQRFLQVGLWAILLAVVACVVAVYVAMERNELLSRVSKTSPNRIEFDRTFLTNILAFIVPLIGIVLAQFPYVSDTLNQWFEPITMVFK